LLANDWQQCLKEGVNMRKPFLLLAILVALCATVTAFASSPNVLINVTNAKISKYADGASAGASGWSLTLGYVAIHSWELSQKPFGTYLYLDQPTSIGIKGSDGQVRSYSSFRVLSIRLNFWPNREFAGKLRA
jgi:hypothetical protein